MNIWRFEKKSIFIVSLKNGALKALNERFDILFDIPTRFKTQTTRYIIPLTNLISNDNNNIKSLNNNPNNNENSYNDKGDLSHTSNKDFKIWSDGYFYENYKYDSHGNWIFRTWGAKAGEPKYIETREIIYCDTKDELKGKAEQLLQTVGDIIKAKQQ